MSHPVKWVNDYVLKRTHKHANTHYLIFPQINSNTGLCCIHRVNNKSCQLQNCASQANLRIDECWQNVYWISYQILSQNILVRIVGNIINTMKPEQNSMPFAEDILKCIFVNLYSYILIQISLRFASQCSTEKVSIGGGKAWRQCGFNPMGRRTINQTNDKYPLTGLTELMQNGMSSKSLFMICNM